MRVPRIYVDIPLTSGAIVQLPVSQSNYLCKALRMEAQRELWLFNGEGGAFKSVIHHAHHKNAQVAVGDQDLSDCESPLKIELGLALSRGDRFDLVVQKATELGVSTIYPLQTDRIDVRLNADRMNKKLAHWRSIAVSACEQCGRNILPVIREPLAIDQWLASIEQSCKLILDPVAGNPIKDLQISAEKREVAILIGPEGGFSDREKQLALTEGLTGVTLGPRILRTETAPLAMISILQALWGDF